MFIDLTKEQVKLYINDPMFHSICCKLQSLEKEPTHKEYLKLIEDLCNHINGLKNDLEHTKKFSLVPMFYVKG